MEANRLHKHNGLFSKLFALYPSVHQGRTPIMELPATSSGARGQTLSNENFRLHTLCHLAEHLDPKSRSALRLHHMAEAINYADPLGDTGAGV